VDWRIGCNYCRGTKGGFMVAAAVVGAGAMSAAGSAMGGSANASANKKAAAIQAQQYAETKSALEQGKAEALGYIDPYAKVGANALNELAYGMGLATPATDYKSANIPPGGFANYGLDQYKQDVGYTPMVNTLEELQATPGYQFQLEQGLQGVNRSAAARGGLLSGANLKAINDYAQGQAATGYQAAWDRAQNAYTNAFGRNQQKFQNLQTMANNGQSAAGMQGNAALSVGQGLAGASSNYGNNMSSLALAQGQNQANMYTGISNALGGTLTGLAGSGALGGASRMGGGMTGSIPSGWNQSNFGFNNGAGWGSL
jgi:hypothetical protein